MTNKKLILLLKDLEACKEAIQWVEKNRYTLKQAWDKCERSDWLIWFAGKTKMVTHQEIVLVACACAETVLCYVPKDEDRPRKAIEAARKWALNPTEKNRNAVYAYATAVYAYAAAYAAAAVYAARAAAYAADAAYAAAYAAAAAYARAAADYAYAAADARVAAAYDAYVAYAAARADAVAAADARVAAAYVADAAYAAAAYAAYAADAAHTAKQKELCNTVRKMIKFGESELA